MEELFERNTAMKREGQIWLAFFALLFGIPLVVGTCSFLNGRIDDERAKKLDETPPGQEQQMTAQPGRL